MAPDGPPTLSEWRTLVIHILLGEDRLMAWCHNSGPVGVAG